MPQTDLAPSPNPQGLFFDDSYGFYPGQVLIGPAKIFSSVQWLSGVKPVLSTKSKFRVVVEEVGASEWSCCPLVACTESTAGCAPLL